MVSPYAQGMGTRDIHDQLRDLYGVELSAEMVSRITDKILPQVKERQLRPLNPVTMATLLNISLFLMLISPIQEYVD